MSRNTEEGETAKSNPGASDLLSPKEIEGFQKNPYQKKRGIFLVVTARWKPHVFPMVFEKNNTEIFDKSRPCDDAPGEVLEIDDELRNSKHIKLRKHPKTELKTIESYEY